MPRKIFEVHRTAVFAWGPSQQSPYIAAGTKFAAFDDSFSYAPSLELYKLDLSAVDHTSPLTPVGKVENEAAFKALAWGSPTSSKPQGIIAGVLDNSSISLWDPAAIASNKSNVACLFEQPQEPGINLSCVDFRQSDNQLAAAGKNSLFIWDTANIAKVEPRKIDSLKDEQITSVSWNKNVAHIMSLASDKGSIVIYDCRAPKVVIHIRKQNVPISSCVWDPSQGTRLVTAFDSERSADILLWDLRHASDAEKRLSGHTGGVLDLSWCDQDSDFLISSAKDGKTLIWSTYSGSLMGEISQNSNYTFQARWCPSNPDLLATASDDGNINVFSLLGGANVDSSQLELTEDGQENVFEAIAASAKASPPFDLKPPKWLRRTTGASFGFGGKLVSFKNIPKDGAKDAAAGLTSEVKLMTVITNPDVITRSQDLEQALEQPDIEPFINEKLAIYSKKNNLEEKGDWEVLQAMAGENPRQKLMNYLGFSKDEIASVVSAVTGIKKPTSATTDIPTPTEPVASEVPTETVDKPVEETTEFDFFDQAAASEGTTTIISADDTIEKRAAAHGSGEPLELCPSNSSDTDQLITRAIVLGDFESAVDLCLTIDRLSDALMLAVCGGTDLLVRTQKAYLERQASKTAYLRLLDYVVNQDLASIVQLTPLSEWKSIFVILCTYASSDDFSQLCEMLGDRLVTDKPGDNKILEQRRSAVVCYLAATNIEKAVSIWVEEQEEKHGDPQGLQNLMEKVAVFRKSISYNDPALSGDQTSHYPLEMLYGKYCEYAEFLSAQGHFSTALKYVELTPKGYRAGTDERLSTIHDRVFRASHRTQTSSSVYGSNFEMKGSYTQPATNTHPSATAGKQYQPSTAGTYQPVSNKHYQPPAQTPLGAVNGRPSYPTNYGQTNQPATGYKVPYPQYSATAYDQPAAPPTQMPTATPYQPVPPPPRASAAPSPPPKSTAGSTGGGAWNDPPVMQQMRQSPRAQSPAMTKRVISPFPNAAPYFPPPGQTVPPPMSQGYGGPMGSAPQATHFAQPPPPAPPANNPASYYGGQAPPSEYNAQGMAPSAPSQFTPPPRPAMPPPPRGASAPKPMSGHR